MSSNLIPLKGARELPKNAPKTDRSTMDTLVITLGTTESWKKPRFQRELRITPRVKECAEQIRRDGVIEGVITLGKFDGETWLLDGQHRIEAFRMSELDEVLADVRIKWFDSMGDMADEFTRLNRALVSMRTDDIMRAFEETNACISMIRRRCPFVGYDHIRVGERSKILISMATVVRIWFGTASDTPTQGPSSSEAVRLLNDEQASMLCDFLTACFEAWGNERSNFKMWSAANIAILMWLWRRLILQTGLPPYRGGTRVVVLERKAFINCLMALSADPQFSDWLVGRNLSERDRAPCYSRIRTIFGRRLATDGVRNPRFPAGEWTTS